MKPRKPLYSPQANLEKNNDQKAEQKAKSVGKKISSPTSIDHFLEKRRKQEKKTQERVQELKRQKDQKEMMECTFYPNVRNTHSRRQSYNSSYELEGLKYTDNDPRVFSHRDSSYQYKGGNLCDEDDILSDTENSDELTYSDEMEYDRISHDETDRDDKEDIDSFIQSMVSRASKTVAASTLSWSGSEADTSYSESNVQSHDFLYNRFNGTSPPYLSTTKDSHEFVMSEDVTLLHVEQDVEDALERWRQLSITTSP